MTPEIAIQILQIAKELSLASGDKYPLDRFSDASKTVFDEYAKLTSSEPAQSTSHEPS